jgi:hypothetical protein
MKKLELTPITFNKRLDAMSQEVEVPVQTNSLLDAVEAAHQLERFLENGDSPNAFTQLPQRDPVEEKAIETPFVSSALQQPSPQLQVTKPINQSSQSYVSLSPANDDVEEDFDDEEEEFTEITVNDITETGQRDEVDELSSREVESVKEHEEPRAANEATSSSLASLPMITQEGEMLGQLASLKQLIGYDIIKVTDKFIMVKEKSEPTIEYYREHEDEALDVILNYSDSMVPSYLPFNLKQVMDADEKKESTRLSTYNTILLSRDIMRVFQSMNYRKSLRAVPDVLDASLKKSHDALIRHDRIASDHILTSGALSSYKVSYIPFLVENVANDSKIHQLAYTITRKFLSSLDITYMSDVLNQGLQYVMCYVTPRSGRTPNESSFDVTVYMLRS